MSTTITRLATRFNDVQGWDKDAAEAVIVTTFWGGIANGLCVQLTMIGPRGTCFIPLTAEDLEHLATILLDIARGEDTHELQARYGGDEDIRDLPGRVP